jgi:hypothetical protein
VSDKAVGGTAAGASADHAAVIERFYAALMPVGAETGAQAARALDADAAGSR